MKRINTLLVFLLFAVTRVTTIFSQPSQGDWIVTGIESVENKSVVLNGNLIVKAGGSLTLRNATLTVSSQFSGQYGISVEPGGSMFIYNSKITPSDLKNRFTFTATGKSFVMKDSELHGAGWCKDVPTCIGFLEARSKGVYKPAESGLLVESDDALINDNLILENAVGVILTGSRATVSGNIFLSNDVSAIWVLGSRNMVMRNSINHAGTSQTTIIGINGQANTLVGNIYTQTAQTYAEIFAIYLGTFCCHGSPIWNITSNNIIANNTITNIFPSLVYPVWIEFGSHNIIVNNTSVRGGGISVWHGVNNTIEGNSIHTIGNGGIYLAREHRNIIINNRISGEEGVWNPFGIVLDHSSTNFILNNEIKGDFSDSSVLIFSSKNNTIGSNHIINAQKGIFLYHNSDGNTISNNEIRVRPSERTSSISIDSSSSNLIYNNLVDESAGSYDNGNNQWYHEGRGNYWSLYTSVDKDGDGIGDTPYRIPPNGVDNHPLINPARVKPSPLPETKPILFPEGALVPNFPAKEVTKIDHGKAVSVGIIEDKVMEVEAGSIPGGLTVKNSTLILGRKGPVFISAPLTIEKSVLIAPDNGYGFAIQSAGRASIVIRNSKIYGAGWGDWGIGSSFNSVGENLIIENSIVTDTNTVLSLGLGFQSLRLLNNTFSGLFYGVAVTGKGESLRTKVFIAGNIVNGSLVAAFGIEVGDATVRDNVILRSWGLGIGLYSDNIVVGNTITNSFVGLQVGGGNIIYHNNFINNTFHVMSKGNDRWNLNGEGNYWSDYTGKDDNFDGIGDTPYLIGKGPKGEDVGDNFPFMRKSGWLTKFWLTVKTNFPNIPFRVNGTEYRTGADGVLSLRLGYPANYEISFTQELQISEDSRLQFSKWQDGSTSNLRVTRLSSNNTLEAIFEKAVQPTTTTATPRLTEEKSQAATPDTTTSLLVVLGFVALGVAITAVALVKRRTMSPHKELIVSTNESSGTTLVAETASHSVSGVEYTRIGERGINMEEAKVIEKTVLDHDPEGDVLYISFGSPNPPDNSDITRQVGLR